MARSLILMLSAPRTPGGSARITPGKSTRLTGFLIMISPKVLMAPESMPRSRDSSAAVDARGQTGAEEPRGKEQHCIGDFLWLTSPAARHVTMVIALSPLFVSCAGRTASTLARD